MKRIFQSLLLVSIIMAMTSCDKDEGKLPNLAFKTTLGYTSSDVTLPAASPVLIGINASKSESEDVLKKFNVSKSINGGTATTVFDKDLAGAEGDTYSYDYITTVDATSGQKSKYTFTVTNRDGITNQVSLTLTTQ
ncbi:MAG TPA: hypothetical protein VK590_14605 [Saprospiraceae bacterium]|nr:hypothetical protein [Saprospiraceae bacterium]